MGQIYEEVVSHFVTSGVPIRVPIDIESGQLNKLTEEQQAAIRENLKALGFGDDDWSTD
jgi:hypothetical protein